MDARRFATSMVGLMTVLVVSSGGGPLKIVLRGSIRSSRRRLATVAGLSSLLTESLTQYDSD
jgi:hypothetical protein